jgi:hypothetical protein
VKRRGSSGFGRKGENGRRSEERSVYLKFRNNFGLPLEHVSIDLLSLRGLFLHQNDQLVHSSEFILSKLEADGSHEKMCKVVIMLMTVPKLF